MRGTGGTVAATSCRRSCAVARRGCSGFGRRNGRLEARARETAEAEGTAARGRPPGRQGPVQLHGSGVADHERAGPLRAGLQRAGRGRGVCQLIVGQAVTQEANDKAPVGADGRRRSWRRRGSRPRRCWPTTGIVRSPRSRRSATRRIDAYIATTRLKHRDRRLPCPRGPMPTHATRDGAHGAASSRRRPGRPSTRGARRSSSRSSGRSNTPAASGSFSCGACGRFKLSGRSSA